MSSTDTSPTQLALLLPAVGAPFELGRIPAPTPSSLGPGEALIKNFAAGLNPADHKSQSKGFIAVREWPAVIGYEGAGTVEAVGEGVTRVKVGDRVAYMGVMENKGRTFQQWIVSEAEWLFQIPDNMDFETAASVPAALTAALLGVYQPSPHGLGVSAPWRSDFDSEINAGKPFVVLGGASQIGQWAIQFAHNASFSPIITTASLHNSGVLRGIGATHVLDRSLSAERVVEAVETITGKKEGVTYVFDAVAFPETQRAGLTLLAKGGKMVVTTSPVVQPEEGSGKEVIFVRGAFQFNPIHEEFGREFLSFWPGLVERGELKPNPVEVLPGGLNAIADGLERLKTISGKKLVVKPWETEATI
ncbi:GroES-like protein [Coniophora puteana RWD-64-598 SS2]|uniref:GroES-like protein n=1 Tax=Coniophora puteana (strain RWD-64-598) TaxID=741705 RepID=A0A5M3MNP3_CONPW|nr:GroES-like protein [Coniophora puteana RWD-64-598 SS2]EIW80733.1 GroES-like protein [Coniophora puteana RWD-64-598 SS2]